MLLHYIKKRLSKCYFLKHMRNLFIESALTRKYYLPKKTNIIQNPSKIIVFCVDGKISHGGLADRFSGLLDLYALSKIFNFSFKIHFIHPFKLEDYLIPNIYDWTINEDLLYFNYKSTPIVCIGDWVYYKKIQQILSSNYNQYHFYANYNNLSLINNFYNTSYTQAALFSELFKFSISFNKSFIQRIALLPQEYVAIAFRFQNSIGDNLEKNYKVLNKEQIKTLLERAHLFIHQVKNKYNLPVVITTDSNIFLNTIMNIDSVYIIPGEIVHSDNTTISIYSLHEKTFMDFFILGKSKLIIQYSDLGMYQSNFPQLSSRLNSVEYKFLSLYDI